MAIGPIMFFLFFFSKDILKEFFKCALVVFLKSRFKKTVLVENIILIK